MTDERSSLAIAIDTACSQIQNAWQTGRNPTSIALSPALFAQVVALRRREVQSGAPLLLLDLPVIEDATLSGSAACVR